MAVEVRAGYERLMARQTPPFRVTKSAILNEIRQSRCYNNNRYRLPKMVAQLEELAETTESYAIRRIWHYARQFKAVGEMPRRRVLAEKSSVAGPPNRENPRLQAAVDEAIAWLRED